MRSFGITVATVIAVLVIGVVVYKFQLTYHYRYRLTLEVEVDGQVKSGSSVIQVTHSFDPVPAMAWPHYSTKATGEAVFVDLEPRGNLFMLLTDEPYKEPEVLAARIFHFDPVDQIDNAEQRRRARALTAQHARAELTQDRLPLLVTFRELTDPKTAQSVSPTEFETVFGAGVRFKGAWIEMTADPVSRGIEKKLLWWSLPGRPASVARQAMLRGRNVSLFVESERLFVRN